MRDMTLSVIVPALNEGLNIGAVITDITAAFGQHSIKGVVIVINDGSSDKTGEIVENLARTNNAVKLINHQKTLGIGFSFWDGVRNSTTDLVVMFPGDNEVDARDALQYIILMDKVDILIPFMHNVEVRDRWRRLISSVYRFIINMSFGINLNYTNGAVIYRRKILDGVKLKSRGFFYQAELLIKLIRRGYLFAEVPNFIFIRKHGKSKATTLKSLVNVIKDYVKLFFEIHILALEAKKENMIIDPDSVTFEKRVKHSQ